MRIFLYLSTFFLLSACSKDNLVDFRSISSEDYFAFGVYYGECLPPCGQGYVLQGGKLFQTVTDKNLAVDFESVELLERSVEDFQTAVKVFDAIPSELFKTEAKQIGQDHTHHDGANYLIQYKSGNTVKQVRLEAYNESEISSSLNQRWRKYSTLIGEVLEELR